MLLCPLFSKNQNVTTLLSKIANDYLLAVAFYCSINSKKRTFLA